MSWDFGYKKAIMLSSFKASSVECLQKILNEEKRQECKKRRRPKVFSLNKWFTIIILTQKKNK